MTAGRASITVADVLSRWPVIVAVMLIAVGSSIWSHSRQVPMYAAVSRIVIVPLAQWDNTFLGTSLVRDSGDATRTAVTVAAELNSRHAHSVTADYLAGKWTADSVAEAVKVSVFEETNVIEITATADTSSDAIKLADGFAAATMADRWKTISAELDSRIDSVSASAKAVGAGEARGGDNPTAETQLATLETLRTIRDSGADPTMRVDSTTAALPMQQLPPWAMSGLAAAGGLVVGILCAAALAALRRPSASAPIDVTDFGSEACPTDSRAWSDADH